jgi:hypothetical protein
MGYMKMVICMGVRLKMRASPSYHPKSSSYWAPRTTSHLHDACGLTYVTREREMDRDRDRDVNVDINLDVDI